MGLASMYRDSGPWGFGRRDREESEKTVVGAINWFKRLIWLRTLNCF